MKQGVNFTTAVILLAMIWAEAGLGQDSPLFRLPFVPDTLDFGDSVYVGESSSIVGRIIDYGEDTLVVTDIRTPPSLFYISLDSTSFVIAPHDTAYLVVTFSPEDSVRFLSQLYVRSSLTGGAWFYWKIKGGSQWFPIAGVDSDERELPKWVKLLLPYPNPFNSSVVIPFELPIPGAMRMQVFSMDGRLIESKSLGMMPPGRRRYVWNAAGQASGVFLVQLQGSGAEAETSVRLIR